MNMTKLSRLFLMLALVAGLCLVQPSLNAQQDLLPTARPPNNSSRRHRESTLSDESDI